MPNRIIKESIHSSEKINSLTDWQFRLWVNLVTYVDDYGRGDARPAIIKGTAFPLRERIALKDIEKGLLDLAGAGCVGLYNVDGKPYLYFPNWESHQRIQTKRSKFPAPDSTVAHGDLPPESESNPNRGVGKAAPRPSKSDYEFYQSTFNTVCTKCKVITEKRRKAIRDFEKQMGKDSFEEVCSKANDSAFCTGSNDRGWKADFDFLIRVDKAANVLAGKYDGKGTASGQATNPTTGKSADEKRGIKPALTVGD